jgi:hypothetical protein
MIFREILNCLVEDDASIVTNLSILNSADFPDWNELRTRVQAGSKTIADHTLKMFEYALKNKQYLQLDAKNKRILKLALMLHDVAKSRGGEAYHEIKCAKRAKELLTIWGYEEEVINAVYFLVRHHTYLGLMNSIYADKNLLVNELTKALNSVSASSNYLEMLKVLSEADVYSRFDKQGAHFSRNDWIVNIDASYCAFKEKFFIH